LKIEREKVRFKILKRIERREKISTPELLKILSTRYKKLQKFLLTRMELANLLSINKISPRSKKFSVIGIIREIDLDANSIIVEDLTGELRVTAKEISNLVEDEVIGIVCERKGDEVIAKRILHPDIPIYRDIGKCKEEIRVVFLPSFSFIKKVKDAYDCFVVLKEKKDMEEVNNKIICFDEKITNPSLIEINGIKIFISDGKFLEKYEKQFGLPRLKTLLELLKKRHLNPKISKESLNDKIFLLDELLDIIAIKNEKTNFMNYTGITLICCGKDGGVGVNLKTREVSKIDFGK
jgi:DNA polymerase II small subunit/DNA polymerase delta subunit B